VRIRTDDEVYRVDAVWLGPPKATFPWRARYVAWGVGIVTFLLVLLIERRIGIGFGFFSTAWAVVVTIIATRVICKRINHERPLGAVTVMWLRELTAPRQAAESRGGAASATGIRVRGERPRRQPRRRQTGRQPDRQPDRQTGRQFSGQPDHQPGWQTDRRSGRRSGRREEGRRVRATA
jgi:hypothetical protein